ncbi:DUF2934 domain-containing protein [Bosea sp. (in: a-proteobacteria)]|uniref:DUF2934 domain-containing protein n=1 Tax=Bosea sp. (in: a-proteobacteria) TaxID=1871050 RepID=UPI003B3A1B30
MSREQIVRDTAYAIWEAEGKPQGRDAEHWRLAEERVAASLTGSDGKAKAPAKAKAKDAAPKAKDAAATRAAAGGAGKKATAKSVEVKPAKAPSKTSAKGKV